MPNVIKSINSDVVHITLYARAEILDTFNQFKYLHRADIVGERPYLVCQANCLDEALVLTALMCRATGVAPACFHYDKKACKLYVCVDIMGYDENYLKRMYIKVIQRYSTHAALKHLTVDITGDPLFHVPTYVDKPAKVISPKPIGPQENAADTFHRERDFPFNTSKFPIHPSLTTDVLCNIVNPSSMEEPE